MTAVATPAGAVCHQAVDGHALKWHKAHSLVRRLQARLVKAPQAGRWGKVRALPRLLTHSFSAKMLAVKRVTENQGQRTPGVQTSPKHPLHQCGNKSTVWRTRGASCIASQRRAKSYREPSVSMGIVC